MRVLRNLEQLQIDASVVAVGNFDGVHLAHQALLRSVVEVARSAQVTTVALTFDPHPTAIVAPHRAPRLLTTLEQRIRLIAATGIDLLVILPFTRDLAQLSPAEFVRGILVDQLHAIAIHEGPNFRFGHRHSGHLDTLRALGQQHGFRVEEIPEIRIRGESVSSSRVRELLAQGRVQKACRLLGRPFSNCGEIVSGSGIGRKQTVPTLNLAPVTEQLPEDGVYVSRTRLGGRTFESVSNVGRKPTFGEHRVTVECYLLNASSEVTEAEMEVEYWYRLRDEIKFPDAAALRTQILKDVNRSLKFHRLLGTLGKRQEQDRRAGLPV
jgi:riboflavin kinase/FMN adenylyltransferase